jgi:hypothetical protein
MLSVKISIRACWLVLVSPPASGVVNTRHFFCSRCDALASE